jgi:hypothetical protein
VDNSKHTSTLCQCLSFVPFEQLPKFHIHQLDRGKKKLLTIPLLKVFIAAQLKDWRSYDQMEEGLLADEQFSEQLGISYISGSQLSRRITQVPTELIQGLFLHTVAKVQPLCKDLKGVTSRIGKLKIIDSSSFKLPSSTCDWAFVKSDWSGVKVHVKLAVDSSDVSYPEEIIPSLGFVDDRRGANQLVVDADATYVLDRGYIDYGQMDQWDERQIHFVLRLWKNSKANVIEEYPVEPTSNIIKDAKVKLGSTFRAMQREIRLVEFRDEQGRQYRVATNRWDLSAQEVAEIYKNRWLIELFFKWLKQHLPAAKIHCSSPQGIWNEIFLAMIAYLLSLYIRLTVETRKTQWQILNLIRTYADKAWGMFQKALKRTPSRTSRGRQKVENRMGSRKQTDLSFNVALINN